jgi:TrmH family RNA methyltransferase
LDFIKSGIGIEAIYTTENWLNSNASKVGVTPYHVISMKEMVKISALKNPSEIFGVFAIPNHKEFTLSDLNNLVLMLDDIRDPGNLGTIIRTADFRKHC